MKTQQRRTILIGPYPPPFGGVSIFLRQLFFYLSKNSQMTFWFYSSQPSTHQRVRFFTKYELPFLLLRESHRARIIESAHFLIEYPHPILLPVWVACKMLLKFEWIKIIHDGSLPSRYQQFSLLQKRLFHLAIRASSKIIVVSKSLYVWIKETTGHAHVEIVQSLLPLNTSENDVKLPETIMSQLSKFPYFICSLGAFIESYGFRETVEAVGEIRKQLQEDIGLVLIESGFAKDIDYKTNVLAEKDWVVVLEELSNENVLKVLKKSNAFVRGFSQESFGISRIEALWCGTPVVATNVGETRGMLTFEAGNVAQLTAQLIEALQNPAVQADVARWAEFFHREAEENLQKFLSIIED